MERRGTYFLDSENGFLDLENWFLAFGIFKYWNVEHPNWHLGGFKEPLQARGALQGQSNLRKEYVGRFWLGPFVELWFGCRQGSVPGAE